MTTLLFFDDFFLTELRDVVRVRGEPEWLPEATLHDDLSDGTWNYPSVFRDPATGRYRALYTGVVHTPPGTVPGHADRNYLGILLAESDDGVHWEKPDTTGRASPVVNRQRRNQVFAPGVCNGGPAYFDVHEPDPTRRIKFLYSDGDRTVPGLKCATSPDGLTWRIQPYEWGHKPLDSPEGIFFNAHRGVYVISHRNGMADRRVAFTETTDFVHFTEPELVMHPDSDDPPLTQFYGMPVFPYEDLYVGLLWTLHTEPSETGFPNAPGHKRGGYVDCALAYSYTGRTFNRGGHRPFIRRAPPGTAAGGCVYPSTMLVADDQIRFYSGGSPAGHFQTTELIDAALLLHTLRLDGFFYVEPVGTRGTVVTRCLRFTQPDLRLNVAVPAGRVRCQLLDGQGVSVPGFTFEDAEPFVGDERYHRPRWTSGRTLGDVLGQPVLLAVEITNGRLYAIRGAFDLAVTV